MRLSIPVRAYNWIFPIKPSIVNVRLLIPIKRSRYLFCKSGDTSCLLLRSYMCIGSWPRLTKEGRWKALKLKISLKISRPFYFLNGFFWHRWYKILNRLKPWIFKYNRNRILRVKFVSLNPENTDRASTCLKFEIKEEAISYIHHR